MEIVIVTGSAGLVGSEAVHFFCEKNFRVVGIDNDMQYSFLLPQIRYTEICQTVFL
jgi:CDP-paratose 2-epimerase